MCVVLAERAHGWLWRACWQALGLGPPRNWGVATVVGSGGVLTRLADTPPTPHGVTDVVLACCVALRGAVPASPHSHYFSSGHRPTPYSPHSFTMSWQAYVDDHLVASGFVTKAAIHGHAGGVWATSAGFNVSSTLTHSR